MPIKYNTLATVSDFPLAASLVTRLILISL